MLLLTQQHMRMMKSAVAAGITDPYWANVTLMMPGTGANNGIVWSDLSITARTITRNGTPITSTAQSKFNGSSTLLSIAGDNLSVAPQVSLSSGDFCLEGFIYLGLASNKPMLSRRASANGYILAADLTTAGTQLAVYMQQWNAATVYEITPLAYIAVTANTWVHVCWERIGNVIKTYINGVSYSSLTTANRPADPIVPCKIGQDSGAADANFNGYLSWIRLTQRAGGRYGANFSPPTAAYPSS